MFNPVIYITIDECRGDLCRMFWLISLNFKGEPEREIVLMFRIKDGLRKLTTIVHSGYISENLQNIYETTLITAGLLIYN